MMAFPDTLADTKIGQLSGGERNRVQLARLLRRGGNLLVLDEPTNDLDLADARRARGRAARVPRVRADRLARSLVPRSRRDRHPRVRGRRQRHVLRRQLLVLRRAAADREGGRRKAPSPRPSARSRSRRRSSRSRRSASSPAIEDAILAAEAARRDARAHAAGSGRVQGSRARGARARSKQLDAARAEVTRLYARWEELAAIPAPAKHEALRQVARSPSTSSVAFGHFHLHS